MRPIRIMFAAAVLAILATLPSSASSQDLELRSLRPGMGIRIHQKGQEPVIGTLAEVRKDTIAYQPGTAAGMKSNVVILRPLAPPVILVPISSIERLEVSIGDRFDPANPITQGVMKGAIVGAAQPKECIGPLMGAPDPDCGKPMGRDGAVAGAVIGGMLGVIKSSKGPTQRWRRIRLPGPDSSQ